MLKTALKLPNSVPSYDTFARVIGRIDPEQFAQCFQNGITAAISMLGAEVIPIDPHTLEY